MTKTLKVLGTILASLLSIVLVGCLLLQVPALQTKVAGIALSKLSGYIDGEISIGRIWLRPSSTLVITDLSIIDKSPYVNSRYPDKMPVDTFATASSITARFSLKGLFGEGFHLRSAEVEGGQFNLVLEGYEKDNLSRIFRIVPNDKAPAEKDIFSISDIKVDDFRFTMRNYGDTLSVIAPGGMDWNDLDVKDIHVVGRDMKFSHGIMYGTVDTLTANEKCGFQLEHLSGRTEVGKGKAIIRDIKVSDGDSRLHLNEYTMEYANVKSFKDYIHQVRMIADIEEGELDFRTVSWFAPGLQDCKTRWDIKGKACGTVDSLTVDRIDIISINGRENKESPVSYGSGFLGGRFQGSVTGTITGLPDIDRTRLDVTFSNGSMTTAGLSDFINGWTAKGDMDISGIAPGIVWYPTLQAHGLFNNFRARAYLNSRIGKARANVRITDLVALGRPIGIDGKFTTDNLNLGRIIGNDLLGPCSIETELDTEFGQQEEDMSVHIKSLKADRLHVNNYDYTSLIALGTLTANNFNGKIICHDPALNFLFQGTVAFSPKTKNALYSFYLNAGMVDLNTMNIDTRGRSKLQFQTMANFKKTNGGTMTGDVNISNLIVENSKGKQNIGNIALSSVQKGKAYSIDLNSSFADARYTGSAPVHHFVQDLTATALGQELPALFTTEQKYRYGNTYRAEVKFYDSMDLLSYVMPGLYIADSTSMTATVDSSGFFKMRLRSPRLAWNEHYIRRAELDINNAGGELNGELHSNEVKAASFLLKENRLQFKADGDHVGLGYTYNNEGELTNRGELYALADLTRDEAGSLGADIDIIPSKVYLNSREWSILPSRLHCSGNGFKADNVEFRSGEQKILIDGGISQSVRDTLSLNLERFDISILNPLTGMDMGIGGSATGSAHIVSPLSDIGILADLLCDSTTISHEPMGTLKAQCQWNEEFKRFDFNCNNLLDGVRNMDARGSWSPAANRLDASLDLDRLKVSYASVFLKDIFTEIGGTVSGRIIAEGDPARLDIRSEQTSLDDGWLKIGYTNVGYKVNGRFDMDEYGVYFKDMDVRDRFGAQATLSGNMYYDHFYDLGFALKLKAHQIEALNLTEKQNEYFYGKVFASGNILLNGPLTGLVLEVDAITSKAGNIHIPLNSSSEASATNLLTFKEPAREIHIDPYEAMMERFKKEKKEESRFDVKMRITATNDVEAFVEIQKETGNVLSGRGNGMIMLDIIPSRDIFDLKGDYTLTSGKYHFVALGLASRDFTIKEGSTVHFNGDIMNTTLDIDANYRTKASLSTLIDDQNAVSSRRNIDCGIKITDKMLSPRLAFSIDVPDLDPMIKSKVENALSTEDKVQKQFLSLIISNNFLPNEQSGIVNNSSVLYSNVSEIMANQLNNIFEKLDIPVDLGLNYQPNEKGTDIFDVALSTQLFNNRVIVNGSVGNKQTKLGTTSNDVVGDLDIEIKLDKAGGWRVNLFSHSADAYTNFLDNSQRNGIGITWQQEFNSLGKYLRTLFMNKEKRRIAKLEEENAMIDGGSDYVKINKEYYEQDKNKQKAAKAELRKARKEARQAARAEKKKKRNDRKQR